MNEITKVILVRHGQSLGNLTRCFIGHGYAPLTELGHEQAEKSAVFLDKYPIDAIYSSDLMRACQTAEHTAKRHGLEIIKDSGLREIFAGNWENMYYDEIKEKYPELYHSWIYDPGYVTLPEGESVVQMRDRVNCCINRIVEKNRGKCIAVFSHATPIRVMQSVWLGEDIEMIKNYGWVSNASVTEVNYHADGHTDTILFGYDEHLSDIITRPSGI